MTSFSGPLLRYARTALALRWEQLLYRPIRRAQAQLPVRLRAHVVESDRRAALEAELAAWGISAEPHRQRADAVVAGEFRFLNRAERLARIDWSERHVGHLWSYNLHYFDYALDLAHAWRDAGDTRYRDRFTELALGWIEGNPVGRGDGWEPYALSLRVVNWIYALLLFGEALDSAARERIKESLAVQAEFLSRRLELHILANHLQKNLKALVVAGLYFEGVSARRWLERGSRLLRRELFEQVLPDGGHYERSPMYHAIALGDFLEVALLARAAGLPFDDVALDRITRMVTALEVLSRPDGSLHLFNDAAQGIAPGRPWLECLAVRLIGAGSGDAASGPLALPQTGYYGWHDDARGERMIVDCGEPGPSYQPGHAHCDVLSFELDLAGRPVIVDSGVCGYDGDPLREYVRSTRAHNTVMIGGRDQSEMWGTFRVARRSRPGAVRQRAEADTYEFEGACIPFWSRRARHHRRIGRADGRWTISDRVKGSQDRLDSFLHFHPDFELEPHGAAWIARGKALAVRVEPFGIDAARVVRGERESAQGWYCPEFGRALPASVLHMTIDRNDGREFGYRITLVSSR